MRHFATGGPVTEDGPIFAHAGEYVVPKGGALVGGGGSVSVTIAAGAIQQQFPIMNDARAVQELVSLLGDELTRKMMTSLGLRVPFGA